MKKIIIESIKNIKGDILIPGSKSISNRILLMSSLSENKILIKNLLECDDTYHMIKILKSIGIYIKKKNNLYYEIIGKNIYKNNFIKKKNDLYAGNSGTVFRFMLSYFSILNNINITLTGNSRMQERPIKDLIDSLLIGGANFKYLKNNGFPPVKILGGYKGGDIVINGSLSSQYISSLIMISPILKKNSVLIINKLVSKPYIIMTIKLMRIFGIVIEHSYDYKKIYINGKQKYVSPNKFEIEGDMTSSSYFLAGAVIKGGPIKILNINKNSIQGDIKLLKIFKKIGANVILNSKYIYIENKKGIIKSININANDIPDVAMTIAIVLLFVNNGNCFSTISNIYNWRIKETDRIYAMVKEMKKIGAKIIEGKDYITIYKVKNFKNAIINTYNDHRIAMCFSLIPLSGKKIIIKNPDCVNKTFPKYFDFLYKLSNL